MKKVLGFIALFSIVSFSVGFFQQTTHLRAAPPAPCKKYQCKTVHSYWPLTTPAFVVSFMVGGSNPPMNTNSAIQDIFTPVSNEMNPIAPNGMMMDTYQFPSCVPLCGLDPTNAKWQAPQEVTEKGVGKKINTKLTPIQVCTAVPNKGVGPLSDDQSNGNDGDAIPPGYMP